MSLIRRIVAFVKDLVPTTLKTFIITALILILVLPLFIGKASDLYEKSNWDDDKTRGRLSA